jgi:HSP20-like domain of unknown function (DUF1813).
MEKLLTVCNMAQGAKRTIGVNLKGEYLKNHGFKKGDLVKVTISQHKITIDKTPATEIITSMGAQNKNLFKLIEELHLSAE